MTGEYRPEQPSLMGVRLKLDRAEEHLDTLEGEIGAYSERQPYAIGDLEREGDWVIAHLRVTEAPDQRWGVLAGEFLHNLRSALDNLVWQLVLVNDERPWCRNQFPIYTDPAKPPSTQRLNDMLRGVCSDHRAVIEDLQPYTGLHIHRFRKLGLRALAELSNTDKHRYLHAAIGVLDPKGTSEALIESSHPILGRRFTGGLLHDGAEIMAALTAPEASVQMQGKVSHEVALGESWVTVSVLDGMHEQVRGIIESFAASFDQLRPIQPP